MRTILLFTSLVFLTFLLTLIPAAGQAYQRTDLVSDGFISTPHVDPNLMNAWGLAFNPHGPAWVADNKTGVSTLYDGLGNPQSLVVTIPPPLGGTPPSAPTGIVFNGSPNFVVSNGGASGPSVFVFATEDGTISGWNPNVPPPPTSTQAILAADNSAQEAIYKGITDTDSRLYVTDFHNNKVDVFGGTFNPVNVIGAFQDPNLPAGYAPFGIRNVNNNIFVTYALQDADKHDDVHGAGFGFVDQYNTDGTLLKRFASQGALNAPWGIALAPSDFGPFSNALLIGNFGDGVINAFDFNTGNFLGNLKDAQGDTIVIDGLWGLDFGNGLANQPTNTLFFAAGPEDEMHGLFGRIDTAVIPEPASLCLAALGLIPIAFRRRK